MLFRTAGDWGLGKGANLEPGEVDENFWEIDQRLNSLEYFPPEAVSIDTIEETAGTLIVRLTDGTSLGPFTLPKSSWRWTDEWTPSTLYFVNDLFSFEGAIWQSLQQHTSAASFDGTVINEDGFVYTKLLDRPAQPYDIGLYHGGRVWGEEVILSQFVAARAMTIPAEFTDSVAYLRIGVTTENIALTVWKNEETLLGYIEFNIDELNISPGQAQFGNFVGLSPSENISLARLDRITIKSAPHEDATAEGLSVTIVASVAGE